MSLDPNSLLGGYTQDELEAAFKLVQPAEDWKLPIDAVLSKSTTVAEIEKIRFAIVFFTGSQPKFTYGRVTAPGYYAAVGA